MTCHVLLAALIAAGEVAVAAANKVTVSVETDRRRYDPDDTIMVLARFGAKRPDTRLHLAAYKGGASYFYLVFRDPRSRDRIECIPLWEHQFGIWPTAMFEWQPASITIGRAYLQQLSVMLSKINLPPGEHTLWLAYSRASTADLLAAVEKATGHRPKRTGSTRRDAGPAELGWNEPVISPPVTITIDPPREIGKQ